MIRLEVLFLVLLSFSLIAIDILMIQFVIELSSSWQDAMAPIYQKLDEAIQAVGKAEGVVYIFDLARTPIPFVGAQSVDVTAKVKTQLGIK